MVNCNVCKTEYPQYEGYFYKDAGIKCGYRGTCKKCCNSGRKKWSEENREKQSNYTKVYNATVRNKHRKEGRYRNSDIKYYPISNAKRRDKKKWEKIEEAVFELYKNFHWKEPIYDGWENSKVRLIGKIITNERR